MKLEQLEDLQGPSKQFVKVLFRVYRGVRPRDHGVSFVGV